MDQDVSQDPVTSERSESPHAQEPADSRCATFGYAENLCHPRPPCRYKLTSEAGELLRPTVGWWFQIGSRPLFVILSRGLLFPKITFVMFLPPVHYLSQFTGSCGSDVYMPDQRPDCSTPHCMSSQCREPCFSREGRKLEALL